MQMANLPQNLLLRQSALLPTLLSILKSGFAVVVLLSCSNNLSNVTKYKTNLQIHWKHKKRYHQSHHQWVQQNVLCKAKYIPQLKL